MQTGKLPRRPIICVGKDFYQRTDNAILHQALNYYNRDPDRSKRFQLVDEEDRELVHYADVSGEALEMLGALKASSAASFPRENGQQESRESISTAWEQEKELVPGFYSDCVLAEESGVVEADHSQGNVFHVFKAVVAILSGIWARETTEAEPYYIVDVEALHEALINEYGIPFALEDLRELLDSDKFDECLANEGLECVWVDDAHTELSILSLLEADSDVKRIGNAELQRVDSLGDISWQDDYFYVDKDLSGQMLIVTPYGIGDKISEIRIYKGYICVACYHLATGEVWFRQEARRQRDLRSFSIRRADYLAKVLSDYKSFSGHWFTAQRLLRFMQDRRLLKIDLFGGLTKRACYEALLDALRVLSIRGFLKRQDRVALRSPHLYCMAGVLAETVFKPNLTRLHEERLEYLMNIVRTYYKYFRIGFSSQGIINFMFTHNYSNEELFGSDPSERFLLDAVRKALRFGWQNGSLRAERRVSDRNTIYFLQNYLVPENLAKDLEFVRENTYATGGASSPVDNKELQYSGLSLSLSIKGSSSPAITREPGKQLLAAADIILKMLYLIDIKKIRGPPELKDIIWRNGSEIDSQKLIRLLVKEFEPERIVFFDGDEYLFLERDRLRLLISQMTASELEKFILSLGVIIGLWIERTSFKAAGKILHSIQERLRKREIINQFSLKLQRPKLVGGVEIPSRLCIQPMNSNDSLNGNPSAITIERYQRYARSGAGLIIVEHALVAEPSAWRANNLCVDPAHAKGVRKLVRAVKTINPRCKLLFHINYRATSPQALAVQAKSQGNKKREMPIHLTLTKAQIRDIVQRYINAAQVVYEAGGDGVELKACHMSLLMNFLMPYNQRSDEYGGSLDNRMRIVREIICGIRKKIPDNNFKISVRLSMYEGVSGGMGTASPRTRSEDMKEPCAMIAEFVRDGVEIVNISAGNAFLTFDRISPQKIPPEFSLSRLKSFPLFRYAKAAKDYLFSQNLSHAIVIGSGFSTFCKALPYVALLNLEKGNMDLVGIGRQAFIDADICHIASGAFEKCARCNKCFLSLMHRYQLPTGCVRKRKYRKLSNMIAGGAIETLSPEFIEFVVKAYLKLTGESRQHMAAFMKRYDKRFNNVFTRRLQEIESQVIAHVKHGSHASSPAKSSQVFKIGYINEKRSSSNIFCAFTQEEVMRFFPLAGIKGKFDFGGEQLYVNRRQGARISALTDGDCLCFGMRLTQDAFITLGLFYGMRCLAQLEVAIDLDSKTVFFKPWLAETPDLRRKGIGLEWTRGILLPQFRNLGARKAALYWRCSDFGYERLAEKISPNSTYVTSTQGKVAYFVGVFNLEERIVERSGFSDVQTAGNFSDEARGSSALGALSTNAGEKIFNDRLRRSLIQVASRKFKAAVVRDYNNWINIIVGRAHSVYLTVAGRNRVPPHPVLNNEVAACPMRLFERSRRWGLLSVAAASFSSSPVLRRGLESGLLREARARNIKVEFLLGSSIPQVRRVARNARERVIALRKGLMLLKRGYLPCSLLFKTFPIIVQKTRNTSEVEAYFSLIDEKLIESFETPFPLEEELDLTQFRSPEAYEAIDAARQSYINPGVAVAISLSAAALAAKNVVEAKRALAAIVDYMLEARSKKQDEQYVLNSLVKVAKASLDLEVFLAAVAIEKACEGIYYTEEQLAEIVHECPMDGPDYTKIIFTHNLSVSALILAALGHDPQKFSQAMRSIPAERLPALRSGISKALSAVCHTVHSDIIQNDLLPRIKGLVTSNVISGALNSSSPAGQSQAESYSKDPRLLYRARIRLLDDSHVMLTGDMPSDYRRLVEDYLNVLIFSKHPEYLININVIEIWRNLPSSGDFLFGIARLDEGLFFPDHEMILRETLRHLIETSLLHLIIDNRAIRVLVATYLDILREENDTHLGLNSIGVRSLDPYDASLSQKFLKQLDESGGRFSLERGLRQLYEHEEELGLAVTRIIQSILAQSRYQAERQALENFQKSHPDVPDFVRHVLSYRSRDFFVTLKFIWDVWQGLQVKGWGTILQLAEFLSEDDREPLVGEINRVLTGAPQLRQRFHDGEHLKELIILVRTAQSYFIKQIADSFSLEMLEMAENRSAAYLIQNPRINGLFKEYGIRLEDNSWLPALITSARWQKIHPVLPEQAQVSSPEQETKYAGQEPRFSVFKKSEWLSSEEVAMVSKKYSKRKGISPVTERFNDPFADIAEKLKTTISRLALVNQFREEALRMPFDAELSGEELLILGADAYEIFVLSFLFPKLKAIHIICADEGYLSVMDENLAKNYNREGYPSFPIYAHHINLLELPGSFSVRFAMVVDRKVFDRGFFSAKQIRQAQSQIVKVLKAGGIHATLEAMQIPAYRDFPEMQRYAHAEDIVIYHKLNQTASSPSNHESLEAAAAAMFDSCLQVNLPEEFLAAIARKNWSNQELAQRAGVSLETVNSFVTGKRVSKSSTITKIAKALGIELGTLEEGAREEFLQDNIIQVLTMAQKPLSTLQIANALRERRVLASLNEISAALQNDPQLMAHVQGGMNTNMPSFRAACEYVACAREFIKQGLSIVVAIDKCNKALHICKTIAGDRAITEKASELAQEARNVIAGAEEELRIRLSANFSFEHTKSAVRGLINLINQKIDVIKDYAASLKRKLTQADYDHIEKALLGFCKKLLAFTYGNINLSRLEPWEMSERDS
ncbi:MAG: helix-turn-helix domain-containing protein, partial [Candidatus Omnitrophica bacterium]|nr:helix-turn-helix domain-containing protein [Candidatus Omnitrophota bacterium]